MVLPKFVLILTILGTASAQIFSMGNCDRDIETVKNFDKVKLAGNWYLIKRSFNIPEDLTKCNVYPYELSTSETYVYEVDSKYMLKNSGKSWHSVYYAAVADDLYNGKLRFSPGHIADEQPIYVLATDYKHYYVAYSCLDAYKGKLEYAWIVARKPYPSKEVIDLGELILKDRNITLELFNIDQDCY